MAKGYVLYFGIVLMIMGITKIQWTIDIIRMKRSKWFWEAISAAISIVCGVVIITGPFSTTAVLWIFIGISLIMEAVFDMIGSIFGNRERIDCTREEV